MPQGTQELNAAVTLANNPDNPFFVYLVDPHGDAVGHATNVFDDGSGTITDELSASAHALAPTPGVWDLIVLFAPQVSGVALSQPFSVKLDGTLRQASATGLPQNSKVTLAAGKTKVVNVTVTNTSSSPEAYFIDARRSSLATYPLASVFPQPLTLPEASPDAAYVVPSNTSELDETLTSTVPVAFDTLPELGLGDPDLESDSAGDTAGLTYQAQPLASGDWLQIASEVGPYGAVGAPQVSATGTASVRTLAFDQTVTSPTGDLWLSSIDPTTTIDPVVLQPGQSTVIPVQIVPKGNRGTTVTGELFVDDLQPQNPYYGALTQADQETVLPYTYTIG